MMKYFARRGILVRPWLSIVTEMIAVGDGWYDGVHHGIMPCERGRKDRKEKREDNTRHSSSGECT